METLAPVEQLANGPSVAIAESATRAHFSAVATVVVAVVVVVVVVAAVAVVDDGVEVGPWMVAGTSSVPGSRVPTGFEWRAGHAGLHLLYEDY